MSKKTWVTKNKHLHPRKLTWNQKMSPCKRRFLLKNIIFRFHINFQGCTLFSTPFPLLQIQTKRLFKRHRIEASRNGKLFFQHLRPLEAGHLVQLFNPMWWWYPATPCAVYLGVTLSFCLAAVDPNERFPMVQLQLFLLYSNRNLFLSFAVLGLFWDDSVIDNLWSFFGGRFCSWNVQACQKT